MSGSKFFMNVSNKIVDGIEPNELVTVTFDDNDKPIDEFSFFYDFNGEYIEPLTHMNMFNDIQPDTLRTKAYRNYPYYFTEITPEEEKVIVNYHKTISEIKNR